MTFLFSLLLQRYGLEHVCTLDNMKAVGLLENQEYPIAFEKLRRQLRLIIHDINENQPQDIAYVFSGFVAIFLLQQLMCKTKITFEN